MADIPSRFKLRRGTAVQWAVNPILANGEPAWETDTKRLRIGDGVTPYNALPYISTSGDFTAASEALASIAGLTTVANKLLYTTAPNVYATADLTAAGRALLDDADAAAMRTTLGMKASGELSLVESTDANNATKSGHYRLQNTCANLPSAHAFECFVSSPNGTDIAQVVVRATDGQMWRRIMTGGAWTAWVPLVDAGNVNTTVPRLGVGQTWQDVTASRSVSTSYQNTTGQPIAVIIINLGTGGSRHEVSANNSTWLPIAVATGGGVERTSTFIVPSGWYYRASSLSTGITWMELRA